MPKVKLSLATQIKAITKYFGMFRATPDEELCCQVWCCIVEQKRFFVEQHVAPGKNQKGIEKRNILFGHIQS